MSIADHIFIDMCRDILENGTSTEGEKVRPHWPDGTSAYTIKKFGVVNRYDLRKEFPILTLRRTALKSATDEILWIWQRKSNNIHDLHSHIWDEWADEDGSIGKAYGYQLGVKHIYREGEMDQVDRVLYDLKNNPFSRRILTNMYNFHGRKFREFCTQKSPHKGLFCLFCSSGSVRRRIAELFHFEYPVLAVLSETVPFNALLHCSKDAFLLIPFSVRISVLIDELHSYHVFSSCSS